MKRTQQLINIEQAQYQLSKLLNEIEKDVEKLTISKEEKENILRKATNTITEKREQLRQEWLRLINE